MVIYAFVVALVFSLLNFSFCSANETTDSSQNQTANRANPDRPDATDLMNDPGGAFVGSAVVPPNSASRKTRKDAFTDGVNKVIDGIENKKELVLKSYGNRGDFLDVEKEFGIPEHSMGCVAHDISIVHEYQGMKAALRWYAARGIYPINSLKSRMAKTINPKLQWKPLLEGVHGGSNDEICVYVSRNNPEYGKEHSYRTLFVRDKGKERKFRTMYFDPYPKAKYAFDKPSDSIWIDSIDEQHPYPSVYNIDTTNDEGEYGKRCPAKLAWRPFLSKAQIGSNEGVFIEKNKEIEIRYQPKGGPSKRIGWWSGTNRWKTSKWAFDKTRRKLWIREEGPERYHTVVQIDRPTMKAVGYFDLSD